jgi:uncharacterized protein YndB with AHSA1/START domain
VASCVFCFTTPASPEEVWAALTCPLRTARYFHGMSLRSSWEPGAPISFLLPALGPLGGEVLWAARPTRLSYLIDGAPDAGATYLTWLVRPTADGCVVRLHVEEPLTGSEDEDDLEDAWLPLLDALRRVLRSPATS